MGSKRTDQIRALLKGIKTGDPAAVEVVNPNTYIQHNPQTHEGGEGLATLFKRLSKNSPRVNVVRAFEDGDYVFAHTEYDFGSPRVGFEIFRFEGDQTVEHWDNIQPRRGPNPSHHTMVEGPTEATDFARTDANREVVRSMVDIVLINGQLEELERFIDGGRYTEHNPQIADDLPALRAALGSKEGRKSIIKYDKTHRILAEGNFVLSVCEGSRGGVHSSFYDLFRVDEGKIVEHWDTVEAIPPRSEWKNENGKF